MDYPVTAGTGMDSENRAYLRGLDDLLPDLKYILPRCDSDITMRKALCEAAQQFCRDTGCFEYTASMTMTNDVKRYVITIPWPADILVAKKVRVDSVNAQSTNTVTLHPAQYSFEDPTDSDNVYVNLTAAHNVNADTVATLKIDLALLPYFDQMIGTQAYALPDKLMRRWRAAFVQGAIARLAGMDGKPWTNKQLSLDARQQYMQLHGEAVVKANYMHMRQGGVSCANPIGFF